MSLLAPIKATFAGVVLAVNTLVGFSLMMPLALLKLVLPLRAVRSVADVLLNGIAENWISINNGWIELVGQRGWEIRGAEGFKRQGWYLVSSNHQSWVDILVLQKVFNRRIPLLKFFIKHELIFVPVIGLAWWALDFPFMRRKGGASARQDLEAARKACEKFRVVPTSVISFLEGTRFTPGKQAQQKSPYQHLLKPKTGGIAMALETLGDKLETLVDVTIVYPDGVPTFTDLLSGRVRNVIVTVRQVHIPENLHVAEDGTDPQYRQRLQSWINGLWDAKDAELSALRKGR
ncbi:acyltransferase [uncultured Aquabacterium sp.]|jgi:1-acyl-sn-glycerol-3-phosphate acyltransferase|uniref:acyltransferase n=1 Tax=uncultured Aquabacterium sp. TaxID=158753 RepID=UPI0026123306|nr:acyltransferase [uncultured Aquabacterium sp.]